MHQQSDSVGESDVLGGGSGVGFHLVSPHSLNRKLGVVVALLVEPVLDAGNSFRNVVSISLEFIVIDVLIVVQIRLIDEMPAGLPASTMIFDVVCESNTLSEGMFIFSNWEASVLKH